MWKEERISFSHNNRRVGVWVSALSSLRENGSGTAAWCPQGHLVYSSTCARWAMGPLVLRLSTFRFWILDLDLVGILSHIRKIETSLQKSLETGTAKNRLSPTRDAHWVPSTCSAYRNQHTRLPAAQVCVHLRQPSVWWYGTFFTRRYTGTRPKQLIGVPTGTKFFPARAFTT